MKTKVRIKEEIYDNNNWLNRRFKKDDVFLIEKISDDLSMALCICPDNTFFTFSISDLEFVEYIEPHTGGKCDYKLNMVYK